MLMVDVLMALICILAAPLALALLPSSQTDLKPVPVRVRSRSQNRR